MSDARRTVLLGLGASAAVAVVWGILAWRSPTLTYHFAPIVAVLVGPMLVRGRPGARYVAGAAAVLTIATALVLWAADKLRGPTFWSDDGAVGEALIFTIAASMIAIALVSVTPVEPRQHRSGESVGRRG